MRHKHKPESSDETRPKLTEVSTISGFISHGRMGPRGSARMRDKNVWVSVRPNALAQSVSLTHKAISGSVLL